MQGTYLLVFRLDTPLVALSIGRLGSFDFAIGHYVYVGSAFGSGGVPARLAYHQQLVKAHPHWHIDYLRPHMALIETWSIIGGHRLECPLASALARRPALSRPIRKFGARDDGCYSHLLYTQRRPRLDALTAALMESLAEVGQPATLTVDIAMYHHATH